MEGFYPKSFRFHIIVPKESLKIGDIITFGQGYKYTVISRSHWNDIHDVVLLDRPLETDVYLKDLKVVSIFKRLKREKESLESRIQSLKDALRETQVQLDEKRKEMIEACKKENKHGDLLYGVCRFCGVFLVS